MILSRRSLLVRIGAALVAPAVVRAESIMKVRALALGEVFTLVDLRRAADTLRAANLDFPDFYALTPTFFRAVAAEYAARGLAMPSYIIESRPIPLGGTPAVALTRRSA